MGWKKLIVGEKMPNEDDPKYKKRKERDLAAGKKVAKFLGLDRLAYYAQKFALKYPKLFMTIVFGIVGLSIAYNVYRGVKVYQASKENKTSTIKRQEKALKKAKDFKTIKDISYDSK